MRSSLTRNLQSMLRQPEGGEDVSLLGFTPDGDLELPEDFEWLDYTIFLLHVASEIEHSLMVQYLYAAYSVGGPGLSDADREKARVWREGILGIAKEEMAHLITVQNLLRAIGGPPHLEREDYPYRSEFYPFHFRLERLTKDSLAKYVYAEAPEDWEVSSTSKEIRDRAHAAEGAGINRVGKLYTALEKIFNAPDRIRDDQFLVTTVRYQANQDEWGRGYEHGGQRGNQSQQNPEGTPYLLIDVVRDRQSAIAAIQRIARQGERPQDASQPDSHFARFLAIYQQIDEANPPSRAVPRDPTTNAVDANGRAVVSHPSAIRWCQLFDLRYRMLLFRLKHAFCVRAGEVTDQPTERGQLIAWTFGEMYNLRAIAGIIIQIPLGDGSANVAGPPFEMPYTISMPDWDSDKWRAHRALIANSKKLTTTMIQSGEEQSDYLRSLENNDALAGQVIDVLMQRALQEERP